ncbi:uncharacterized protein LOC126899058 [Daktulosphaira vitifoliae]|uniref:uncharacterized protein LOC126899058 n=1 Tax=Daktulosphaira vitifoliae TaxID=58002 RepID=UPI0021AAC762|nr:uncharacterized protein LOC126899058 [Daktulosphaira vitifoliae]XP_050529551.1 uncharacterized protein LOC126899058 [Daktulosphaira vitifoliae]
MAKNIKCDLTVENQLIKTMPAKIFGEELNDKKARAKLGWTQKHSSFNKKETETICDNAYQHRTSSKLLKNEKKGRPTANPTTVCLKPETNYDCKEGFAQRLRQAWIDREKSKSCINIYLARNVIENPSMEIYNDNQNSSNDDQECDSNRTSIEVKIQSQVGESENSCDSCEEDKTQSAAVRRVKFYNSFKKNDDNNSITRVMSAPSSRNQKVHIAKKQRLIGLRRQSQEINRPSARKLKSCRSKAFHKSIDEETQQLNKHRSIKKHQNTEVITMMSLLSPVGSDVEERFPNEIPAKMVTFPQFSYNMRYHQKSFDSVVQSIEQPKLLTNRVGKSLIKYKTLDLTRNEGNTTIQEEKGTLHHEINNDESHNENIVSEVLTNNYEVIDGQPLFKTAKEKECWTLFKKMTDKGISVTFDTVLRGMLTPTEYRLRKNELLSYG